MSNQKGELEIKDYDIDKIRCVLAYEEYLVRKRKHNERNYKLRTYVNYLNNLNNSNTFEKKLN